MGKILTVSLDVNEKRKGTRLEKEMSRRHEQVTHRKDNANGQ